MGTLVQAICACGYESEFMSLGVGMNGEFITHDCLLREQVPYYCDHCAQVAEKSSTLKRKRCQTCRHTMKPYLMPSDSASNICRYDIESLFGKKYFYCPACKNESMRFFECGCWD